VKQGNLSDLIEIAARAGSDEADAPECLVRRRHHFAEGGRDGRVVEVLEHHDLRAGESSEFLDLRSEPHVRIPAARRRAGPERGRGGEADHRGQGGVTGADAPIHVPGRSRPAVEQLQNVANGRSVELAKLFEDRGGDVGGHERLS
jgi:hypothetical protein